MRVLVCGGRNYDDWPRLKETLDEFNSKTSISCIIHGCADGADRLAGVWARWNNIPEERYPADWKTHGKKAGYIRNAQMLEEGKPDRVLAFKGGKGTEMMVELAEKSSVPTLLVEYL